MRIRWLRGALENLGVIGEYIAKENPQAARALVLKIEASVRGLQEHPSLGRPSAVSGVRELVITGTPVVIPYRVHEEQIEILRVFHGAQDYRVWKPDQAA